MIHTAKWLVTDRPAGEWRWCLSSVKVYGYLSPHSHTPPWHST